MLDFEYSDDAVNVKAAFYGAKSMVYVEGEDDVVFWEFIFSKFSKSEFEIEEVGGLQELEKKIKKIECGEITAIAARDSDYSFVKEDYFPHQNVIHTFGHSIENTLITPNTLCKLTKIYGRLQAAMIHEGDFVQWFEELGNDFSELVLHDAANDIGKFGFSVLGNNCSQFMANKKSCKPSLAVVSAKLDEINQEVAFEEHVGKVKSLLAGSGKSIVELMRGHFLASISMRYVNHILSFFGCGSKVNNDSFTSSLMLAFESIFDVSHEHYEHYSAELARI